MVTTPFDPIFKTFSLTLVFSHLWSRYQATDGKNYQPSTTHVVSCPDSYRGKYRGMTEETGRLYAKVNCVHRRKHEDTALNSGEWMIDFVANTSYLCFAHISLSEPTFIIVQVWEISTTLFIILAVYDNLIGPYWLTLIVIADIHYCLHV